MSAPNRYTEGLLEIADVVASTLATNGEVRANVGDAVRGTGIDSGVAFWGTDGFLSRPANPDANGAAQYLFYVDGNHRYAVGSRDRRTLGQAPQLDPGDRVVVTPGGMSIHLDDSADEFVLTTAGGSVLRFSDAGLSVELAGGASMSLTNSEFDVTVPTTPVVSGMTIDSAGVVIAASNPAQNIHLDAGLFVTLGLNSGGVRPVIPTVTNVNVGPGAGLTVPSPKVYAANT